MLIGGGAVAVVAGLVWVYRRPTHDSRYVGIDIRLGGVNRALATSAATLPLHGGFDIGLGDLDSAITARADGLRVNIKQSTHAPSWPGDLDFLFTDR